MAVHGVPRATGDSDVWVQPTETNALLVWQNRSRAMFGAVEAFVIGTDELLHDELPLDMCFGFLDSEPIWCLLRRNHAAALGVL